VYVCTNRKCQFTFERAGSVEVCEDCGGTNVREASVDEIKEYLKNRDESKNDEE
jgi:transcription initiation factor IIE alpha subunit